MRVVSRLSAPVRGLHPATRSSPLAGSVSVRHRTTEAVPITVAMGDGVGPEIMKSTLAILDAAGANLKMETIEIGEKIYKSGHSSGIAPASWDSLRRTKVFLKAPITTPSGGGFKSLNVSIRKTLGLYANVRPCISYHPFVATKHPKVDMVIVRENEEDLYAGIEHRQTNQVYQCLKLVSRPGCERIVRYAFEYARMHGRKRVTCVVKDNIMKLTDGLFYDVFESIGKAEYPEIVRERMIVDIAAAMIADKPERFDVVVTLNLYGDIISDVAAQITGSVGLGGSANIGEHIAMFEAIHGSAPDIAGKDIANPTGLLLGAVQMLMHVKHAETATNVYNAWLRTIEDGVHTGDIYSASTSSKLVGTKDFTKAVIERLGSKPRVMSAAQFHDTPTREVARVLETKRWVAAPQKKILTGVDVFLDWDGQDADELAARLNAALASSPLASKHLKLALITNRGVKVWPGGFPETFRVDHWRCRFRATASPMAAVDYSAVLEIMRAAHSSGLDVIKSENLCVYENVDGSSTLGFSLGQGE